METNDIILSVTGTVILFLVAAVVYFYQRDQKRNDDGVTKNAEKLEQISNDVTALMAKQEGQISFAKALMESQAEQVLLHRDVSKIHERFDEFFGYMRNYVNKRIEWHEEEHHPEVS